MNYTNLIKDAWRFVWRRKSMPALSFTSMVASSLAYGAIYGAFLGLLLGVPGMLGRVMGMPLDLPSGWPAPHWWLLGLGVGLVLWLLFWLLGLGARGGMIHTVDESEDGRRISFGGALGRGLRLSPRLALMSFLLHLPAIVLIAIAQVVLLAMLPALVNMPPDELATTFTAFYALSICLSCATYGLLLFLQFIYAFAYRGVVIGNRGAIGAIRHGWQVARRHAGDLIPLAMIFLGVALLLGIIWYAGFFVLYIAVFVGLAVGGSEPSLPVLVISGIGMLFMFLLLFIVGAFQSAWRSAAFTMAYRHWMGKADDEPAPPPKTEFLL